MGNIELFEKKHIPEINGWYGARGLHLVPEHMFPEVGLVAPGICAGFLYRTDSSLCFLDGYIANPKSTKGERQSAFDLISHGLIRMAKDHGFRSILAYTEHPEIAKRCEKFQFLRKGDYTLYVKGI